jgi:hypothetical protein
MGVTSALPISEPPLAGFVLPGSGAKVASAQWQGLGWLLEWQALGGISF